MAGLLAAAFFGVYKLVIMTEMWQAEGRPAKADRQVRFWGAVVTAPLRVVRTIARPVEWVVRKLGRVPAK